ncbi:MAG TPA: hypothetical protein VFP12_15490 [Allosphingosinicella sp.]|nr:hypothetical protein [Allosphingosinicella sp.]
MRFLAKAAALAAMMLCLGVAQAQGPRTIELPAKAAFKHRHSKVQLPPVLAGLPRTMAAEYEADQLDTTSEYATPDFSEAYTVYIYRNVAGGLPVWFDRARWMLEQRATLGDPALNAAGAFVPPGRTNASGMLASYAVTGKGYKSTGIALVPVGEWLVKIRASSRTLTPSELEARMKSALAEIAWPKKMAPAPGAAPILPCATGLALTGDAKPAEKDESSGAAMLVGALLGQVGATREAPGKAAPPPATHWCRDSIELAGAAVYRADEQADGYLIALGDAGRAVSAGRNGGDVLLDSAEEKKAGGDRYEVRLIFLAQTMTSRLLDRLPPPAQALAIVEEGRFATSFGTWGKGKGQLTIGPDALQ